MDYSYYITPQQYEIGLSNGISHSTLTFRVRRYGWGINRACNEPVKQQNATSEEIKMVLKQNNISVRTFKRRINAGWDSEKAIKTPPLTRQEALTLTANRRRKISEESYLKAESIGVNRNTLAKRLSMHWTLDRAINTPTFNRGRNNIKRGN